MFREITVDTFREDPTPEKTAELIVDLVKDRDSWKEQAQEITMFTADLIQERNNLLQENPLLRGQVARQRLTIEEQTDALNDLRDQLVALKIENQKLRDAAIHAPFAKYEVYEDD